MRMRIAFGVLIVVWTVLLTRVYYLSIKTGDYYAQIAEQNVLKTEKIPPIRGQILDRRGRPLAVNKLGFSVLIKHHIKKQEIIDAEIAALVECFPDLNATKLAREYKRNDSPYNQDFVEVIDFIDYDKMLTSFAKLSFRENLEIRPISKRFYPHNELASHVVGYVGRANLKDVEIDPTAKLTGQMGRSGVERYYHELLQGESGERKTRVTALNQEIEQVSYKKPSSSDIVLTLDMELQEYLAEAFGDQVGAAVVMDLRDGAILAAASFPEYDLNPFVTGISKTQWEEIMENPDHPFTNKLVNSLYPPGSVVKMTMGMAFFASGKIAPTTRIMCDPYYELGGRKFRNWRDWGYSNMTIVDALRESCDTYFYRGAHSVGIDVITDTLVRFGFGSKTGVDLPNEYVGVAPGREWKRARLRQPWYQGDTLNTSIGQGNFLVTPMQVAKNTAYFASGLEVTPHFLWKVNGEEVKFENRDVLTPAEKSQIEYVRKGMYEVANVQGGTARRTLEPANVVIGAKTGSAQVVGISQTDKKRIKEEAMEYYQRSHAWITTYAPFEAPRYVVTVLVEHGAHGGGAGGPVAAKIYNKLIEMGYIEEKYLKKKK